MLCCPDMPWLRPALLVALAACHSAEQAPQGADSPPVSPRDAATLHAARAAWQTETTCSSMPFLCADGGNPEADKERLKAKLRNGQASDNVVNLLVRICEAMGDEPCVVDASEAQQLQHKEPERPPSSYRR